MKPRALHDANEPNELRRQLSLLIHAWTVDRSPIRDDWNASDAERWRQLLHVLEPVAPRTSLAGARRSAALLGLDWGELAASGDAYIVGTRVAFLTGLKGFSKAMSVREWSLYVERNSHEDRSLVEWLTNRHDASTTEVSSGWFVAFEHNPQRAAIPALLERALCLGDKPDQVLRIWDLAICLGVTDEVARMLPKSVKTTLAQLVKAELERHATHWTLEEDLKVHAFVERGNAEQRIAIHRLPLPPCRFTRLVEGQQTVSHLHRGFDEDYYSSRLVEYCVLASPCELGAVLDTLSPGAAFETALLVIPTSCPRILAEMVRQCELSETMIYVLGCVRAELYVDQHGIDLSAEWELIQSLIRRQALVAKNIEPQALLAQALLDLAFSLNNPDADKAKQHRSGRYWSEDVWQWAFEQNATGRLVGPLMEFINGSEADEVALIFALKFLKWADSENAPLRSIVEAVVALYTRLLTPATKRGGSTRHLSRCGPELADFWKRIQASQYLSGRWLLPISWYELAQKAQNQSSDEKPDYQFDSLYAAREHLSMLATQAEHLASFDAVLDALHKQVVELSELSWPIHPFSWWALSQRWWGEKGERPLFAKLGALYARDGQGVSRVRGLVRVTRDVRALADLLAGALPNSSVADTVRETLLERANEALKEDNPIALGEALDIAVAALAAREARLAERFARRAVAILDQVTSPKPNSFRGEAMLYLATALAHQGMWNEIVQLDLRDAEKADELSTRSLRAEAFVKLSQMGDAARELDQILARHRRHPVAWRARCTLAVLEADFEAALKLLEKARDLLESDYDAAFESIERAARGEDVTGPPTFPSLIEDAYPITTTGDTASAGNEGGICQFSEPDASLKEAVRIAPKQTSIELAIVTILEEEYEAVKRIMDSPRVVRDQPGETFPNRFGWTSGTLTRDDNSVLDVILARADSAGNTSSLAATLRTIDRFRPSCLLVIGVAGGIGRDGLQQGDLVMATDVWYYEYGKVDHGIFTARHRPTYQCDSRLVTAAQNFKNSSQAWVACGETAPRVGHHPKFHRGSIACGEKVIDDLDAEFFKGVRAARPELLAIEMEGAGAAYAIADAMKENKVVAFGMIRGISDMPKGTGGNIGRTNGHGSGTEERDNWKPYASAIAATFVKEWVRSEHWPRFST